MIRSFTTLARTLNLSHAVKELGSTRQTVRRHIAQLEESKGTALFTVEDRQYKLTDAGARTLPEAEEILARGNAWLAGQSYVINGLQYLRHQEQDGWCHFQHQKPIGRVFSSSGAMLKDVIKAWAISGGDLEHEALRHVRSLCTVFRRIDGNWLFTEVGEESSFVSWFGWTVARSSIGRVLNQMPGYDGFGRLVDGAYEEVEKNQSVRLDHIFTHLPKGDEGTMVPICFERLLLGARFPDESFAMISAVRRTYDVEIDGVTDEMLRQMPEDMLM
jgi:biotin operon repressor